MNNLLYARLAKTNLSKNRQNILPYLLSCIGTVVMFFIMDTLAQGSGFDSMIGKDTILTVMGMGTYIIGLFAVIFLIYSNSFLAKRRKKEFGLFQILGMEKKHLAKVLFFESLYLWILSVGGGILLGILCYKLLFLVLLKLTRFQGTIHFAFNWKATGNTVVLFAVIFLINYLKSLPEVSKELTCMVRQLQPTETGIPIELYFFSSVKDWVPYEGIQSDVFDHVLAVIPEFGLSVFQNVSGSDLRSLKIVQ